MYHHSHEVKLKVISICFLLFPFVFRLVKLFKLNIVIIYTNHYLLNLLLVHDINSHRVIDYFIIKKHSISLEQYYLHQDYTILNKYLFLHTNYYYQWLNLLKNLYIEFR